MASQAGWYPDPGGQPGLYRWWTGSAWSESVTPNPQGTPPPTGAGQPPGGPTPSAGYGQATSGYPGYNYPQQKRRGALAWWLVAGAAVIAVVVVVAFVVRGMGGSVPGLPQIPGSNPTSTYTPDICPPAAATAAPTPAIVDDNRISGGKLSFPRLGNPWSEPYYDNRVPFGSLAMMQSATDQENFNGEGNNWVSSVLVSDLYVGDGFASTKVGAETVLKCVLGRYYSDAVVEQTLISSAEHDVDGRDGWLIETDLSFQIPNLRATSERVLLLVVQTDTDEYGLFYASVPNTSSARLPEAREALADLRVDG